MKTIKIKDYYGEIQKVPVSDDMYEEWLELQKESRRTFRKETSHRSSASLEDILEVRKQHATESVEEAYIRQAEVDALYQAIEKLTPTQQRRVRMYMENITVREIANREGCYMSAVLKSIDLALKKLHRLLSD